MNHDEKFEQQRWEFRRRDDDDGDSSDDDSSKFKNSNGGEPRNGKPKLITDMVIHQNDELIDYDDKLDSGNGADLQIVEASVKKASTKIKSRKNTTKKSKSRKCPVKEKIEERTKNLKTKEVEMFKDLKTFGGSLIDELRVAREKMFADMKQETRKLIAYRSGLGSKKKKIGCSQKNKACIGDGMESTMKPQKGLTERNGMSKVSKAIVKTRTKEVRECEGVQLSKESTHMVLAASREQVVVSSPYLTLPTIVPKPQPESHVNNIPLNYPEIETRKMMDTKNNYNINGIQAFRPELYGSFSCKNVGEFISQNCSPMTSTGFGFPVNNLHQGFESGSSNLNYDSNLSNLTYSGSTFGDNSRVDQRMKGRFSALSEAILENNSLSNNLIHKSGGEFVSLRSQNSKDGQFQLNFQRKW